MSRNKRKKAKKKRNNKENNTASLEEIVQKQSLKQRIIESSSLCIDKLRYKYQVAHNIFKDIPKIIKDYVTQPKNFDKIAGTACCVALLGYCLLLYATDPGTRYEQINTVRSSTNSVSSMKSKGPVSNLIDKLIQNEKDSCTRDLEIMKAQAQYNQLYNRLMYYIEGQRLIDGKYQKTTNSISQVNFGSTEYEARIYGIKKALKQIIELHKRYKIGEKSKINIMGNILEDISENPAPQHYKLVILRKEIRKI